MAGIGRRHASPRLRKLYSRRDGSGSESQSIAGGEPPSWRLTQAKARWIRWALIPFLTIAFLPGFIVSRPAVALLPGPVRRRVSPQRDISAQLVVCTVDPRQ
jgi:hypothetical protein